MPCHSSDGGTIPPSCFDVVPPPLLHGQVFVFSSSDFEFYEPPNLVVSLVFVVFSSALLLLLLLPKKLPTRTLVATRKIPLHYSTPRHGDAFPHALLLLLREEDVCEVVHVCEVDRPVFVSGVVLAVFPCRAVCVSGDVLALTRAEEQDRLPPTIASMPIVTNSW